MLESSELTGMLNELEQMAIPDGPFAPSLESALDKVLRAFDCQAGTIHYLDPASGLLSLRVSRGIPESLLPRIQQIPIGKGMAGIAAERREPIQVCNLQTDASGVVKVSARETRMEGSITVPILDGESLRGTLGIAKPIPYEFSAAESDLLMKAAARVGKLLGS